LSKDRSKEILREIRSLRQDLEGRLEEIEDRLGMSRKPDLPGDETSLEESRPSVSHSSFPAGPVAGLAASGAAAQPLGGTPVDEPALGTGSAGLREVTVNVRPLTDVSLARAVESSLQETDGIMSARLTSLSGDAAVIHTVAAPGVSVVRTLRRTLPVAFDVTESSDHAISIELALRQEPGVHLPGASEEDH
jgi:hypothetical protein